MGANTHVFHRVFALDSYTYRKGLAVYKNEDLTTEEAEIERTDNVDGEEAPRIGEFSDLRDRLERIESVVTSIIDILGEMRTTADAIDIDNGATVTDADGDGDADIIEDDVTVIPDYDDLDLDL